MCDETKLDKQDVFSTQRRLVPFPSFRRDKEMLKVAKIFLIRNGLIQKRLQSQNYRYEKLCM